MGITFFLSFVILFLAFYAARKLVDSTILSDTTSIREYRDRRNVQNPKRVDFKVDRDDTLLGSCYRDTQSALQNLKSVVKRIIKVQNTK